MVIIKKQSSVSEDAKGQHIEFEYKNVCTKPEDILNCVCVFEHHEIFLGDNFSVRFRQKYAYRNKIYIRFISSFFQSIF